MTKISEINVAILTLISLVGTLMSLYFVMKLTGTVGLYVLTILSWFIAYATAGLTHLDELRQKNSRRYKKNTL